MTTNVTRTEKLLVLYGSQTGNAEQAAKDLCEQCRSQLTPANVHKWTGSEEEIRVVPVQMQLDDFLELAPAAAWTRLVVIVVSSYGVGSAPLGGYRFRELCDAWAAAGETDKTVATILDGVHFALCGLGDSKYTTYFQNPTRIDEALRRVGAKRVGPLGQADASGTGSEAQQEVIERWTNGIWPHLAEVIVKVPLPRERLEEMQRTTVAYCRQINPDFSPEPKSNRQVLLLVVSVAVALLSAAAFYYLQPL
jgi:MioC protein